MKRCNFCFKYSVGQPTYCTHCGRTFDVRICSRGHMNPRGVEFCAECGSDELSTPAPAESALARWSRVSLQVNVGVFLGLLVMCGVLIIVRVVDWEAVAPRLVLLGLVVWFLYWTTTLLPGPVKRIGRAAGRQAMKAIRKDRKR